MPSMDDATDDPSTSRTVTVPIAVYRRLERWRDALVDGGVAALPEPMRRSMRAALLRTDGRHKGVVGLGAVLAAAFESLGPAYGVGPDDPEPRP